MDFAAFIGRAVRARRLELGLSQLELALAAGYGSRSAISKIESGSAEPPLSKLAQIADALDTTVSELLADTATLGVSPDSPVVKQGRDGKCVALVLAGGSSSRNGLSSPTQFAGVLGRPVVSYILEAYQRMTTVQALYAVCLSGWESVLSGAAVRVGASKLSAVVTGGATGLESVRAGVRRIVSDGWPLDAIVVIQESARPLVNPRSVERLVRSCNDSGSSVVCEPLADHLAFRRKPDGTMEYLDRNSLFTMQSPDAHRLATLLDMFEEAERQNIPLSENCCGMLLHQLGWPLTFIQGERGNVKVTRREDLAVLASLLGRS